MRFANVRILETAFFGIMLCACGASKGNSESSGSAGQSSASGGGAAGSGAAEGSGGSGAVAGMAGATTGSSGSSEGATECPEFRCDAAIDRCFCGLALEGWVFLENTGAGTDNSGNAEVSLRVEAGAVCLSGSSPGLAAINFGFGPFVKGDTGPAIEFDFTAHGITQLGFTVGSPPAAGLNLGLIYLAATEEGDVVGGASWADGWNDVYIDTAGSYVASLSDFVGSPLPPDPTRVFALSFYVWGAVGSFDYCIRDLKFLDADGNEVSS